MAVSTPIKKCIFAIIAFVVTALIPDMAYAWGPGVHLALGNSVLADMGCLPPLVAALLDRHRNAFLYGCLSADIFIGKGTNFRPGHSHNWVTGFKLLNSAKDARVLAYGYGYLTHLAADVVAHNYYVPNALMDMNSGSKLSHVYVEAQADRSFRREQETALSLFRRPNRDSDDTLLSAMDKRRFPFVVKKQILKGSLTVTGRKTWGTSLRLADRILPGPRVNLHLDEMFTLSQNIIFDFLTDPKASPAVSFDPIGSGNLRRVRDIRIKRQAGALIPTIKFHPHESLTDIARPVICSAPSLGATVAG